MEAKKFEQAFDDGVGITASLDLPKVKRVLQEQMTTNVQSDDAPLNLSLAPNHLTHAQHRHGIFRGREVGVGTELIDGFPQADFNLRDIVKSVGSHLCGG